MRVIAGSARGIRLKAPPGMSARPTLGKVKEALFSTLGPRVYGALVADLFAGSGALGIEALSRGAGYCVFIEYNRDHLQIIRDNLEKTGLSGRSRLLKMNTTAALQLLSAEKLRLDIIFIDPPYHSSLAAQTLQIISKLPLLKEDGLVVVEHPAQSADWTKLYPFSKHKRYGTTGLSFIRRQELCAAPAEKERHADSSGDI